eukprot:scaffold273887_cov76-Cyclotella_meneghiniana.AAC.3
MKLAGKKKADDGDSVSSDSSVDSDSEDKRPALPPKRPPLPKVISGCDYHPGPDPTPDFLDIDDVLSGNALTTSMRQRMEGSKSDEPSSNGVDDFAVNTTTEQFADQMMTRIIEYSDGTDEDKAKNQAMDYYEERLRRKLESSRANYRSSETVTDFNLSPQRTQEARNWSCVNCTYINEITSPTCKMCKQPNGNSRRATVDVERSTLPGACSVSKMETRSTTWQCKSCTYKENKIGSVKCLICDVPRDGAVVSRVSEVPSTPGAFSVCPETPAADATISEWKCTTCTFKHNKITSVVCEVCQEPDQDLHSLHITERESNSSWHCSSCTYVNNDGMTEFCGTCGATRFDL